MINQKQAVTNAIMSLFPKFVLGGEIILKSLLTPEFKKQARALLFEGFRAGEVTFAASQEKLDNDAYLNKYVSGLLDNWVRKNPEFNNGNKYVTQNPGSRAGSQDESIREMRKLLKTTNEEEVIAEIQTAIQDRLAIIKPNAVIAINVEALPEHLRHLAVTE